MTDTHALAERPHGAIVGVEGLDDRDLIIPRIQLLQDKAQVLKKMQKKKVAGAVAGVFMRSDNEEQVMPAVEFVPAYMTRFWDIYDQTSEKKNWVARCFNLQDERLKGKRFKMETRGDLKLKAEVSEVITCVCLVEGEPAIINFKATSREAGKTLYTLAKRSGKALYEGKYVLTAEESQDRQNNQFYVMRVSVANQEPSHDETEKARSLCEAFSGNRAKIEEQAAGEAEVPF